MEDEDERNRKDDEDKLLDELAAQGMHKNLSFFAFTATPKGKTLQLFGQKDAEGIYRPFHIYSMRQAIEEHFILDVLQNYMTYKMYYKIAKIIEDNPEFDTTAGSKAIINYETLHPHNISQKTAIMLEHFMNVTRHKIGGRAKAMVVTPCGIQAAFITLDIDMADELIRKRERSLKGAARAKLSRTKEFDHSKWVGGGMLDYRFSNARRIVNDIYAGEVSADV